MRAHRLNANALNSYKTHLVATFESNTYFMHLEAREWLIRLSRWARDRAISVVEFAQFALECAAR